MAERIRTVSVSKGRGYIPHNVRAFTPVNSVPERTHLNRTYVHEDLDDAYESLFGDAIRTYDKKQKRADRRIGSSAEYLARMKGEDGEGSKNGEQPFHEVIIQVGDMHDMGCGTPDEGLAVRILDGYARGFQERNPRLHVIGMYLHLDEATPHLHVDFIPVADEYKTGMSVRNGLDRALRQQGVSVGQNSRKSNATISWQDQERDALADIMQRYGVVRADPTGSDRKGLPISQYRAAAQSMQKQIEQQPLPEVEKTIGGAVRLSGDEWEKISGMHQLSLQLAESADHAASDAARKIKEAAYLRSAAEHALNRSDAAEKLLTDVEDELEWANQKLEHRSEIIGDLRTQLSAARLSAQHVYAALTAALDLLDPQDILNEALLSALQDELEVLLENLHGTVVVPEHGPLAPLVSNIAADLLSNGASLRFDDLAADGTASLIADVPGRPSVVLASSLPDFETVRRMLGRMMVHRNVRTRAEFLADARAVVTPLLQAVNLGPDTPRDHVCSLMYRAGVPPVVDVIPEDDLWNILASALFSTDFAAHGVAVQDVTDEMLADFWLPKYPDAVRLLDQTAQARAKEWANEIRNAPSKQRHQDGWSR